MAVQQKHDCIITTLESQRFNFLVECPDCHWQGRAMTQDEADQMKGQHKATAAARQSGL